MSHPSPDSGEPNSTVHQPVMLREVLEHLDLQPGQTVVDGTVGAGGHSRHILEHIQPGGTLIGLDRDPMMLRLAREALPAENVILKQTSYALLDDVLDELSLDSVDRALLDLGLSSDQLADEDRGFGFAAAGELDLRFDVSSGQPAWRLLERLSEKELTRILEEFGEERFSRRIARRIVARRRDQPVRTAADLVEAVKEAIPAAVRRKSRRHPATRVFQALRIAVNDELGQLSQALEESLWRRLSPGGRLVVISFHSLEDRIVKQQFRDKDRWHILTPKPVTPSQAETRRNPRSRSAKLRAATKR